jgi:acetyl-CoA carboxylase biotin carboxyl carrier protein
LNLKELKEILQMLEERDITEFELTEEGRRLRVTRPGARHAPLPAAPLVVPTAPGAPLEVPPGAAPTGAPEVAAPSPAAPPPPAASSEAEPEPGLTVVKSPIVGTFFRSPDPSSPAFVSVGDRVKVGQVLCIVEAMKLMNEIEAEVAGEIVKVHHDNGQPVQYGEPLFTLRP